MISIYTQIAQSEENLLTVKEKLLTKIKFAPSKNLLKKFAHSRNLLTEFSRSIENLLMTKNLASSDGSTRWLNVSHQSEHGWRAPLNGLSRNRWNVLGRTFQYTSFSVENYCLLLAPCNVRLATTTGRFGPSTFRDFNSTH
jgi:hypothetical protein